MRLTAIASAVFAVVGHTPSVGWIPDGALSAPEPIWLALWGVALIGFSSTLRTRVRLAAQAERRTATSSSLDAMQPSVARSI